MLITQRPRAGLFFHVILLSACIATFVPLPCLGALTVETAHLVVSDEDQQLGPEELRRFSEMTEDTFVKVLAFWSISESVGQQKIFLKLHPKKAKSFSVFESERGAGGLRKTVSVYGLTPPLEMVHKLTHAIFPTSDKLIRNMSGIPTEARFGKQASFPMCGFNTDAWVAVIRRTGSYIPLGDLGEKHEDWGMSFNGGMPVINDRKKQHASYCEAGSFGAFLLKQYGVEKVKDFYRSSRQGGRLWQEVFGVNIATLEDQWLASLDEYGKNNEEEVIFLEKLWKDNPKSACEEAQNKVLKK